LKIETQCSFKHKMVELKARVGDHELLRKKLFALGAEYNGTFQQSDLYFKVPEGRLKLREVENNGIVELIYYERENIPGPKSDDAFILRVQEPEALKKILKKILTPLIVIEKVREIYQYQGTVASSKYPNIQVHLDTVKNLGTFLELEMETSDKTCKKDKLILQNFVKELDIKEEQLEKLSYSDLLAGS